VRSRREADHLAVDIEDTTPRGPSHHRERSRCVATPTRWLGWSKSPVPASGSLLQTVVTLAGVSPARLEAEDELRMLVRSCICAASGRDCQPVEFRLQPVRRRVHFGYADPQVGREVEPHLWLGRPPFRVWAEGREEPAFLPLQLQDDRLVWDGSRLRADHPPAASLLEVDVRDQLATPKISATLRSFWAVGLSIGRTFASKGWLVLGSVDDVGALEIPVVHGSVLQAVDY